MESKNIGLSIGMQAFVVSSDLPGVTAAAILLLLLSRLQPFVN